MGHTLAEQQKRRQQLISELLDRLCRAECAKQGIEFVGVERSILPIPGQEAPYKAIGRQGPTVRELPLSSAATKLMQEVEAGLLGAKEAFARLADVAPANIAPLPEIAGSARRALAR